MEFSSLIRELLRGKIDFRAAAQQRRQQKRWENSSSPTMRSEATELRVDLNLPLSLQIRRRVVG